MVVCAGGLKGIVGVVTKPLAGVFDLVSETSAAVRHSAGRGAARGAPTRARLPRVRQWCGGGALHCAGSCAAVYAVIVRSDGLYGSAFSPCGVQ